MNCFCYSSSLAAFIYDLLFHLSLIDVTHVGLLFMDRCLGISIFPRESTQHIFFPHFRHFECCNSFYCCLLLFLLCWKQLLFSIVLLNSVCYRLIAFVFFPYSSSILINILSVTAWALSHKSPLERIHSCCCANVGYRHHFSHFVSAEFSSIFCKYCPHHSKNTYPICHKAFITSFSFFLLINTNTLYRAEN